MSSLSNPELQVFSINFVSGIYVTSITVFEYLAYLFYVYIKYFQFIIHRHKLLIVFLTYI